MFPIAMSWRPKNGLKRPLLRLLMNFGRRASRRFDRPVHPNSPRRAMVIQLGGIGDVLRVFPLLEQLQLTYPQAEVALFTNQGEALLELYQGPRLIRLIRFDLGWGYPRKLWFLFKLRRDGIDLVVNPTRGDGMVECAAIAWLVGAPQRIGFDQDGAGFLHTHKQPFSATESILEQNQRLLAPLGIDVTTPRLQLRISQAARTYASEWYTCNAAPGSLRIVIHPWAISHGEFRAWPFSCFAELIGRIMAECNATILLVGSANEASGDREPLAKLEQSKVRNLAGATRLPEVAALIAACDLFIGNDSGLLHLALSANVPTVAVFGATPPSQILPPHGNAVSVVAGVPCQPCYRHQPLFEYQCAFHFRCLRNLPVNAVFDEVLRLVRQEDAHRS